MVPYTCTLPTQPRHSVDLMNNYNQILAFSQRNGSLGLCSCGGSTSRLVQVSKPEAQLEWRPS